MIIVFLYIKKFLILVAYPYTCATLSAKILALYAKTSNIVDKQSKICKIKL